MTVWYFHFLTKKNLPHGAFVTSKFPSFVVVCAKSKAVDSYLNAFVSSVHSEKLPVGACLAANIRNISHSSPHATRFAKAGEKEPMAAAGEV